VVLRMPENLIISPLDDIKRHGYPTQKQRIVFGTDI
jgi:hypothetical protein